MALRSCYFQSLDIFISDIDPRSDEAGRMGNACVGAGWHTIGPRPRSCRGVGTHVSGQSRQEWVFVMAPCARLHLYSLPANERTVRR